jgi:hypothetical protein
MMTIIHRTVYRFSAIILKIPDTIMHEIGKSILKFMWDLMEPRIAKLILKKKKKLEVSDFLILILLRKL